MRKQSFNEENTTVPRLFLEEIWGQRLKDILMRQPAKKELKEVDEIRRVIESRRQMQMADARKVKESDIPLDVLYNLKIERIRATEDK